jgi:hypothetical protein
VTGEQPEAARPAALRTTMPESSSTEVFLMGNMTQSSFGKLHHTHSISAAATAPRTRAPAT